MSSKQRLSTERWILFSGGNSAAWFWLLAFLSVIAFTLTAFIGTGIAEQQNEAQCVVVAKLVDPERERFLLELDCGGEITDLQEVSWYEFEAWSVGDLYH